MEIHASNGSDLNSTPHPQVFTRTLAPPSPEALTQFLLLCVVIIHFHLLSAAQNVLYCCLAEDDVWWEMLLQPSLENTFCHTSKCYRNSCCSNSAQYEMEQVWSKGRVTDKTNSFQLYSEDIYWEHKLSYCWIFAHVFATLYYVFFILFKTFNLWKYANSPIQFNSRNT